MGKEVSLAIAAIHKRIEKMEEYMFNITYHINWLQSKMEKAGINLDD
jgi:hypothetical protein